MTNPAEALDAIERLVYDIAYKRSVGFEGWFVPTLIHNSFSRKDCL